MKKVFEQLSTCTRFPYERLTFYRAGTDWKLVVVQVTGKATRKTVKVIVDIEDRVFRSAARRVLDQPE